MMMLLISQAAFGQPCAPQCLHFECDSIDCSGCNLCSGCSSETHTCFPGASGYVVDCECAAVPPQHRQLAAALLLVALLVAVTLIYCWQRLFKCWEPCQRDAMQGIMLSRIALRRHAGGRGSGGYSRLSSLSGVRTVQPDTPRSEGAAELYT